MLNDVRYALRLIRRNPGFATWAILALAIGIGASATVFGVVNQALLKPPGYNDPDGLALIQSINVKQETVEGYSSWDDFQDMRRESKLFTSISGVSPRWSFALHGIGRAEEVHGQWVSASLFTLLGVNPILGRPFTSVEDRVGAPMTAVLSYGLWQRAFGGSPAVIGKQIQLDDTVATVVGVMPREFRFLEDSDIWVPLALNPINQRGRAVRYLTLAARLAPGGNLDQSRSEISGIMKALEAKYPNSNTGFSPRVTLLRQYLTVGTRPILLLLAGAVALVLLIACANVASLLLTRMLGRRQELAVRIALGAGRFRLARQMMLESVMVSAIGGALGLIAATWGTFGIRTLEWTRISGIAEIGLDARVIGFTIAATVLSGLAVGLLPALRSQASGLEADLRAEGRANTVSATGQRMRSALVIGEIALTTVLLAGSGLLLRSLIRLLEVDPGFAAREVLTFQVDLGGNANQYARAADRRQFYERFAAAIETLPGVRAAGAVSRLPLAEGNITSAFTIEGRPIPEGDLPSIDYRIASGSYFGAMGIPLLSGRIADPRNPDEVNLNQTAARRFWPGENPLGRRVKFGPLGDQQSWKTVVGIVGDVHHLGLEISPRPEAYRPYIANPLGAPVFAVRSTGNLDVLTSAIRERLRALDPQLPMFNVYPMEQLLDRSLESRRFSVLLLSLFAGIALLLAAIGLYGLLSYAVGMRPTRSGFAWRWAPRVPRWCAWWSRKDCGWLRRDWRSGWPRRLRSARCSRIWCTA